MSLPRPAKDERAPRDRARRARPTRRPLRRAVWVFAAAGVIALGAGGAAHADQSCPQCQRGVPDEYRYCPFDGAKLPSPPCPRCHKPMLPDWRFCPFDGASLTADPTASRADPAAESEATTASEKTSSSTSETDAMPPPTGDNPVDTIDRLFRAIQRNDVRAIRSLYRWDRFFGRSGPALEPRILAYVSKLTDRVGPVASRTDRVLVKVNLAPRNATLGIALRDRHTRAVVQKYEFQLTDKGDGWRIVNVKDQP